jgi:hypothetical protein
MQREQQEEEINEIENELKEKMEAQANATHAANGTNISEVQLCSFSSSVMCSLCVAQSNNCDFSGRHFRKTRYVHFFMCRICCWLTKFFSRAFS